MKGFGTLASWQASSTNALSITKLVESIMRQVLQAQVPHQMGSDVTSTYYTFLKLEYLERVEPTESQHSLT
jgi:formate hydrogenlyase subunit 4